MEIDFLRTIHAVHTWKTFDYLFHISIFGLGLLDIWFLTQKFRAERILLMLPGSEVRKDGSLPVVH